MNTKETYDLGISQVAGLGKMVAEAGDFLVFLRIRQELNQFLLNLNYSNHAEATGQQIHFLFLALRHLDNVDREIRISSPQDEWMSMERIQQKIRSLKILILDFIRHLTAEV